MRALALPIAILLLAATPARADFVPTSDIAVARAPLGYDAFCADHLALCTDIAPARALTAADLPILAAINTLTNAAIDYRREAAGNNDWRVLPDAGDCEDYAVTKMSFLVAVGFPRAALLLAAVVTDKGEHHMVLVAQTVDGSLALDSRIDPILPWRDTQYRWRAMEQLGPDGFMVWHPINPWRAPQ